MRPSNLTTLDFEEIRESIKSYMRTRPEFTDYDFTGSALSYLVDVLAYNTYYSAFNANMALNEVFLESATLRDNVVSIARMLNYLPRSAKSAWGCVTIDIQANRGVTGNFPTHITLKKGQVAVGNINNQGFSFSIIRDKIQEVDSNTGLSRIGPFKVYEGDLLTYIYTVDTTINQNFIIPNENVDIDTLQVYVKANAQSTTVDRYSLVTNITTIDKSSKSFFISEYEDRRYEITFGDGIVGKALEDGNVVILEYIVCKGAEANNIKQMKFAGKLIDIDLNAIGNSQAKLTLSGKTQLGDRPETIKSIKFNAPRFYAAQNRAVTTKDYENIVKTIYPNARYVMATGGETLSPPVYGKVFVSIKTKNNVKLNNLIKKQIIDDLRPYSMASIEVVVQDPEEVYVDLNVLVVADLFQTASGVSTGTQTTPDNLALPVGSTDLIKEKALYAIKKFAIFEDLGNFNKTLSTSKIQKEILQADPSIIDVLLQVTVYKLLAYPEVESQGKQITWDVNFGIALDCSCSSEPGDVVRSSGFYTVEYPLRLQFLEDDGQNRLRAFYLENNTKIYTNLNAGFYDCEVGIIRVGPIAPVGEAEYIQIGVRPKNPGNISPGEITGKTLARSILRSGTVNANRGVLSSGSVLAEAVNSVNIVTAGGQSADAIQKISAGIRTSRAAATDGQLESEIKIAETATTTSSTVSKGFTVPTTGVKIDGETIDLSNQVGTGGTIGGVTISGTGITAAGTAAIGTTGIASTATAAAVASANTAAAIATAAAAAAAAALVSPTAAAVAVASSNLLTTTIVPSSNTTSLATLSANAGSPGAPGSVIIIGPPSITVVPPGNPGIGTFQPNPPPITSPGAILTTPPVLDIPVTTPVASVGDGCFN